jgi:hypothetical protein
MTRKRKTCRNKPPLLNLMAVLERVKELEKLESSDLNGAVNGYAEVIKANGGMELLTLGRDTDDDLKGKEQAIVNIARIFKDKQYEQV